MYWVTLTTKTNTPRANTRVYSFSSYKKMYVDLSAILYVTRKRAKEIAEEHQNTFITTPSQQIIIAYFD